MKNKDIKLFVSVYKSECVGVGDIILPVSAGAKLYNPSDTRLVLCDDLGENISARNPGYCELTVQYWAWKNCEFDVGGLMHQRRYFDFSDPHPYACDQPRRDKRPYRIFDRPDRQTLDRIGAVPEVIRSLTDRYEVIAPLGENIRQSVLSYYDKNDRRDFDDLSLLCRVIGDICPEYLPDARQYLGQKISYFCNMFIMSSEQFDMYSRWLFGVLMEYDRRKPREKLAPREQGKLAERLFGIYMTHLKASSSVTWAELPRAHFAEINGTTVHNMSFNRSLYHLCPPGSLRRGLLRRIKP